jgi:pyruvoyl-dependent arginine decarboxylase (PvlArgDC)
MQVQSPECLMASNQSADLQICISLVIGACVLYEWAVGYQQEYHSSKVQQCYVRELFKGKFVNCYHKQAVLETAQCCLNISSDCASAGHVFE